MFGSKFGLHQSSNKQQNNQRQSQSKILFDALTDELRDAGITLTITRKRVKNINFRLKPHQLNVSVPTYINDAEVVKAIDKRLDWAINHHAKMLKRLKQKHYNSPTFPDISNRKDITPNSSNAESLDALKGQPIITLWGEPQSLVMGEAQRIEWYRRELKVVAPTLFAKWQPIVGKTANEIRIKKMKTRWGTCNTQAKRVWLSVYLPAYPIVCTEYVIVHELCHLHHANHSAKFWAEVERAMPDYKRWHDMLAGRSGSVD